MYDFRKSRRSQTNIIFQNDNFQKERPELLAQVKRQNHQYWESKRSLGHKKRRQKSATNMKPKKRKCTGEVGRLSLKDPAPMALNEIKTIKRYTAVP